MDKTNTIVADNRDTDIIGSTPRDAEVIGSTPRDTDVIGSTPFDDVYRTLTTKITKLVIPLINEMFGTTYPEDEPIRQISNEHYTRNGKIITDSIFEIRGVFYHVECQSGNDAAMSIRMFEYDVSIAIRNAEEMEGEIVVRFPRSAVLYVRDNGSTPDAHIVRIELPNGREAMYECSVMKVSNYSWRIYLTGIF